MGTALLPTLLRLAPPVTSAIEWTLPYLLRLDVAVDTSTSNASYGGPLRASFRITAAAYRMPEPRHDVVATALKPPGLRVINYTPDWSGVSPIIPWIIVAEAL